MDATLLVVQGLRGTTRGGHVAVMDAVRSQFNDRGGTEVFGRLHALRRRRNRTEMMIRPALDTARAVLDAAPRILDSGALDLFE